MKLAAVLTLIATPAWSVCGPYAEMAHALTDRYGEVLVMAAKSDDGSGYYALYVGGDSTFTLLLIDTAGTACVVATGHDAEVMKLGEPT